MACPRRAAEHTPVHRRASPWALPLLHFGGGVNDYKPAAEEKNSKVETASTHLQVLAMLIFVAGREQEVLAAG
ncbi:hypothetical protein NDU88_005803 [Pleurodeles waltl]|uniref:Uncharacterized protein n=1 Tax=Pleurodeles waltl TaxID=8319 RepID=A0AAV7NNG8_PLEWA|nr:hypothetical protein NDU88_005803 [Pleurodeles waltl]